LYKICKTSILTKLTLRGNFLTKKFFKKNSKQTLIFLRAPKHFNIGKHKVSCFKNFYKYMYNFNYKLPTEQFLNNKLLFLSFFSLFHKIHFLYVITSIKISTKVKIKWCVIGGMIVLLIVNAIIFSCIFWILTFIFKYFYSSKNFNYKLNFYECGFKSLNNIKIQYNINFTLVMLFLLIYDGEFLILRPIALNISLLNFNSIFLLVLFILLLLFTLIFDYIFNSWEWQI
jgi:NADH:ubiquinone oxidoreductase subunit 3 (subunit A)